MAGSLRRTSFAADEYAAWFPKDRAFSRRQPRDRTARSGPANPSRAHLIHLGKEAFAACLLAFAGVFETEKAHLAHGRLGSGVQAYFITLGICSEIP